MKKFKFLERKNSIMNKNEAFSLMEVIVSVFILILVLIPSIKLIIALGGLLYQGEINIFLQIYIFYLLVFSLATFYIIIYIVISYCRNKSVKIRGVELAFAPYICLAFIIIYNYLK